VFTAQYELSPYIRQIRFVLKGVNLHNSVYLEVKVKIKQSRYRPGVAQRVPGS
jgi:hypothetical protein